VSTRVLIVEDQTTLRELLSELLAAMRTWAEVVACATGVEARALLKERSFDLVLLDLVLPDAHGLDLLRELSCLPRRPRVIVLTAHARASVVRDAMAGGAHAVITKGAPLRELREGIERVVAGGHFYCSETSRLLREAVTAPERTDQLTARQREILRAVASGMSSKEIASALSLSEKTVANHRARIMDRLGVRDVAGLTRHAMALGLVEPAP
jgi:DNA-binding NarL/FixJ family response regulator